MPFGEIKKMKNVKRMLLIGILATASIIGSGCGKSDTSTGSTATGETTAKESKVEETTKKTAQKNKFEYPITLGTIGGMDLMADREFPKAGFFPAGGIILGFDENKGELASSFYQRECTDKTSAEEIWHVEYSEDLDKIPSEMKGLNSIWDSFLNDGRMYNMHSEQKYEVIVDNTEKVSYGGRDFIREEGHIDVTRKDPNYTYDPEWVKTKYIAYYFFSPKDAGASAVDNTAGFGMGMAVWGVRPVDMSNDEEAKTMEENYEKLKKSAESSMSGLTSFQEYWKLED